MRISRARVLGGCEGLAREKEALDMLKWRRALGNRLSLPATAVGLGLVLFCSGGAWAEGHKQDKHVLSLDKLIKMAIARSPEVAENQSDLAVAESHLDQAKAGYYPQIGGTALIGPVNDAEEPLVLGNRIYDPSPPTELSTLGIFGRLDFKVTQPLYTFGKLSHRKDAARSEVQARKFGITSRKNEIALKVEELYYALLLAESGTRSADEAREFFDGAKKRISRLLKLKSPDVTESDLYRVDARRADTLRYRAEAQKGVRLASFALKALIGMPQDAELEVAEKVLGIRDVKLKRVDTYIQEALSERPELKQLKEALEAQKSQVEAAQSDRYPSLFVAMVGSGAVAPGRDTFQNRYIPDEFNHAWVSVVAGVRWDLDFGIKRARIDEAAAKYEKLRQTRAAAEMNIPIQVAKAYQDILEWEKAASAYHEAAVASRKWVFAAFSDFDMGIGTADNMLSSIEKYGHNQGKYLEALFNYHTSLAELEYATGAKVSGEEREP